MADLTRDDISRAAQSVETDPTWAQIEAGSYAKGHVQIHGMHVVIENPKGSTRSGIDPNGKAWHSRMRHHYGYIRSTEAADGDPVDVFIGPCPSCEIVWVIDQVDPVTRAYDEPKVMIGFRSEQDARDGYMANYETGWRGLGAVTEMDISTFKAWLESGESLTAAGMPADTPMDIDPDNLVGTFRGKVIQFKVEGWDPEEVTRPIVKAEGAHPEPPPGSHFITMHPNGAGTPGNVVLVMPVQGHKGVVRVIGGAKGKLNGLRLHGVKSPEEYASESKARRQENAKKEYERKAGLSPEQKGQEKEQKTKAKGERRAAEESFIQKVLGKTGEAQALFEEGESPETPSMSHQERLAKAKTIAKEAERRIMLDAESRVKAGLGQIGGQHGILNLEDILQESTGTGPGYRRALAERASKAGLTAEKLAEKVAEIKGKPVEPKEDTGRPTPVPSEDEAQENRDLHTEAKALEAGKAAAMREAVKKAIEDHGDLAQILKARAVMREAVIATRKDKSPVFEPGYQMVTSEDAEPDDDIVNDIHQKMLTQHVVQFLQEVGDSYPLDETPDPYGVPPEGGMASARGTGAFDCLHETALAAIGQGVIERDVVEALGPEHSAMIVARAMRHEFSPEDQDNILQALEAHHLQEQEKLPEVVDEAQSLKATADAMGTDIAATPRDFALAVEMQKQKVSVLKEARQLLGSQLGRLETRAALIAALRQPPRDNLTIPMGRMTAEKAVQTAASLGLQDGDYQIEHDTGEAILKLNAQGQDRLIHPVDQVAVAERQTALAIKGGQMDEDGWRPKGFADRSATRYDNEAQEPMEFRRELAIQPDTAPEQVAGHIQDYAGALMADGHDPSSIVADLHSGARKGAMSEGTRAAYEKALNDMIPLRAADKDAKGNPIQDYTETPGDPVLDDKGEPVMGEDGKPKMGKPKREMIFDPSGKPVYRIRMRMPSEIQGDLEKMLQHHLETAGDADKTLEGQTVAPDADFHEAMHRALADDPRASAAFTPVGEMSSDQQGHLRDHFYKTYFNGAKTPSEAKNARMHAELEALGPEPTKENPDTLGTQMSLLDMLGEEDAGDASEDAHNPAWIEWNNKRLAVVDKHELPEGVIDDSPSPWAAYVKEMHGLKFAQQALQDEIKGQFNERFHSHYQNLTGKTLHLDTKEQALASVHLKAALGGEEADALESARKAKQAKFQKKGKGKFQSGSVAEHMAQGNMAAKLNQAEGSLFGMDDLEEEAPAPEKDADAPNRTPTEEAEYRSTAAEDDGGAVAHRRAGRAHRAAAALEVLDDATRKYHETKANGHESATAAALLAEGGRFTMGQTMDKLITAHMPAHSGAFDGRRDAVKVREGMHMNGEFINQQRSVKAILNLKRLGLFQGAGSGKSAIQLGALSHLHAEGKLKGKGILAVPSIVQGQFGAEAIQFLDPTSGFKLHAQPGESFDERMKAYKDPGTHAVVITHQTLRDDSLKMLAAHWGGTEEEAQKKLMSLPKPEAAQEMKAAWGAHGIDLQALMVDEGHNALDRDGKEDSIFSRVMDAHSHNAEYVVQATANAMKNDVSEIHSELEKIDPHRWNSSTKDEFMRRYGQHSTLAKRSLQQELTRYFYTGRVPIGVDAHHSHPNIPLTEHQKSTVEQIESAAGKLQTGQGDTVENAKALAPEAFQGKPEEKHAEIAKTVQRAVGTYRENAMDRAINLDPEGGKIAHHVQTIKDRVAEGKPCVIFHGRLEGVDQIHEALAKAGVKAVAITGKDSAKEKAAKMAQFNKGEVDVLVASDACQTGANLQRGKVLIHSTIPKTAMAHQQRTARIHRLGQTQDVEVITTQADHAWERKNWDRVKTKDTLGAIYQSEEGWTDDSGLASSLREVRARRTQATGAAA